MGMDGLPPRYCPIGEAGEAGGFGEAGEAGEAGKAGGFGEAGGAGEFGEAGKAFADGSSMAGQLEEADILEAACRLNRLILASKSYADFLGARKRLEEYPEYREMVDSFRRRQVDFQVRKENGGDGREGACGFHDEEMALANEYADICLINVCNDFFATELALLKLIQNASDKAFEGIDVF